METSWQDLRYAARSLRQHPLFTLVIVLTLALGIGASTAMFSVLDAVMLRPLSYVEPDRLVEVVSDHDNDQFSYPNVRDMRASSHSFETLAPFRYWLFNLSGADHPESMLGVYVGDSLFSLLRVHPSLGRVFGSGSDAAHYPREAVISDALWRRHFAGDRHVVGTTSNIDGLPTTIIGVLPRGFHFPDLVPASAPLPSRVPDLYLPMSAQPPGENDLDERGNSNYWLLGRLAPQVTLGAAASDLARIATTLAHDHPDDNKGLTLIPVPLQREIVGDFGRPMRVLFGAVLLVLLIACANVGGLLLARSIERRREINIRAALGASRGRIARQLLTESLLLALLGGGAGVAVAGWAVAALRMFAPSTLPRIDEIAVDTRVLLFALAGSIITGLLFGMAPALQQRVSGLAAALRDGGRVSGSASSHRVRAALVVTELALAVVLLSGAGLLLRSFTTLRAVSPGFDARNVMTMFTLIPPSRYTTPTAMAEYERKALAAVAVLPGVQAASAVNTLPMTNLGNNTSLDIVGHLAATPGDRHHVGYRTVGGPYFRVMGIHVVAGRDFLPGDTVGAPPVAIINQVAARKFLPGVDPIGKQLILYNGDATPKTIIGVVADVHGISLDSAATPEVSTPYQQGPDLMMSLAIQTRGDPRAVLPQIRHVLGGVDPDQAFYAERTMAELVGASLDVRRFDLQLLGGFAGLALVLAAVGLYGVIAFSVAQRTREIGIRSALGAGRARIARMVLQEGGRLAAVGLGLGLIASLLLTRLLRDLLFGIGATDPLTYAAVLAFLAAVVLLACYLPARRASRVEPSEALRQ